ncbi:MAG: RNase P subunit p30 family protein [Nanoarchaeota archaeon]
MEDYVLIRENDFERARKKINKSSGKTIIFSGDDETNRKILEKERINILLLNQSGRRDRQKQRDSGFNHVLAKLAKKNSVIIGINLDEIISSDKKNKADILARIRQNVRICNKNKLKMRFFSPAEDSKDIYDLRALGLVLGMPTWMVQSL